jgi:CubicO group peptidase (beta-lactamase class C family)
MPSLIRICLAAVVTALLHVSEASSSPGEQLPLNGTSHQPYSNTAAAPVQWFTGRTQAEQENDLNTLPSNGWRLISLNVYGAPPQHRYATVWVQRPGPLQQTSVGVDGPTFDTWMSFWTSQGYVPVIVTITGSDVSGFVNAAVLEKISVLSWSMALDKSMSDLQAAADNARAQQQKMVSIDQYGEVANFLFCAVFHHNPDNDGWAHMVDQGTVMPRNTLRSQTSKPYWRPAFLKPFAQSPAAIFRTSSIYTDTYIGSWTAKLWQTTAAIMTEDAVQTNAGRHIIRIQGGFSGFFHVIWAEQDAPSPREFHATGPPATGFKDNPSSLSTVDGIVKSFMQASGVHEAQVAIGKNGNVLLQRAYTWSEPGRHIIQPEDKFQLASLTKIFTSAAIQSLIDAGSLSLTTRPWVNFASKAPWSTRPLVFDHRYLSITVEHLLNMQGGWDRDATQDWEFHMIDISNTLSLTGPPTLAQFVGFLLPHVFLNFAPGSEKVYSNVGYMALTQVVETVTGMPYLDYLKSAVLAPMGLQDLVDLIRTDASLHTNDSVTQQTFLVGQNVEAPQDATNIVAFVFGGDGAYKETAVGVGNLACSASTVVKFINSYGKAPTSVN